MQSCRKSLPDMQPQQLELLRQCSAQARLRLNFLQLGSHLLQLLLRDTSKRFYTGCNKYTFKVLKGYHKGAIHSIYVLLWLAALSAR